MDDRATFNLIGKIARDARRMAPGRARPLPNSTQRLKHLNASAPWPRHLWPLACRMLSRRKPALPAGRPKPNGTASRRRAASCILMADGRPIGRQPSSAFLKNNFKYVLTVNIACPMFALSKPSLGHSPMTMIEVQETLIARYHAAFAKQGKRSAGLMFARSKRAARKEATRQLVKMGWTEEQAAIVIRDAVDMYHLEQAAR